MHIHILGICGTFMGGIAAIARAAGHRVTGSDQAVYPPMSDQLEALGIELIEGFDVEQLKLKPDLLVIGNIMSRGMPIIETVLNERIPYTSGPAWLAEYVLKDRHVIAISGTHGKTTTASMTAWLLEAAGLNPGFLIGGVPANFATTARLGSGEFFVIEADEYDTAFFDKRAKFMHYGPQTLVINNLEFDHADIYKDMDAILWQFHQLLRLLPGNSRVIANAGAKETEIKRLLAMGCWTPVDTYSSSANSAGDWLISAVPGGEIELVGEGSRLTGSGIVLPGSHNLENAAAAILAVRSAGIDPSESLDALAEFRGVKRRLEHLGTFAGVRVYDDFAHHPTAIERTLHAVKQTAAGRVFAVLEPRSNSMKLGAHQAGLGQSLEAADRGWVYQPADLPWSLAETLAGNPAITVCDDIEAIVAGVATEAQPNDAVVIMSNGGFAGIHQRICAALAPS
jgi:UDP-N-acetylmuramate: L-alanyl-gamma-D-glutamyl-meso-diaminopimelate ligase